MNNIMARYLKTGLVPQSRATGFFGDASALPTFMEAQQVIIDAQVAFEELPAKIRDRFHNSPEKFLAFLGDDTNEAEARALGLLLPEASPAEGPKQPGAVEASPAPSEGQE
jgi:phage internal scaffolding protein